ncbi:helix-turn-helix domain-containing protein [Methylobacterium platani]|uniref:AraC family transcriptional regulator n=2 Tax=Methylobacterium platani TaxID=427683 RepID=A0A179S6C6_9HYPH|nr:helix-turn-helix domain-containing protein [Methylobacterium platani]KMO13938.1 AraC family transcriptional regulator [Methylobacterium platani JCM 14648]OAS20057.1 AraC family transcriptional regulator [Methylobacterium platani]
MKTLISTDDLKSRKKFQTYLEIVRERFVPSECRMIGDGTFRAHIEGAAIGGTLITRSSFNGQAVDTTPQTIRRHDKHDKLSVVIRLSGMARSSQYDRAVVQQPGDITVIDSNKPVRLEYPDPTSSLFIELPREQLEGALGSAPLFAGLTIGGDLPGASLVRTFFDDLVRVHEQMTPDTAERMTRIGADLIVASIAERMAREAPRPLQGTVIVQRAKAYVEANLGDPTLDPPQLAAAMGVSLRHLQQLFHERGRHISDWLWQRRLEVAARRLADPGHAHLPIGALAYGCGFVSQAHFSRRFRDRFDATPSEYRRAALASQA